MSDITVILIWATFMMTFVQTVFWLGILSAWKLLTKEELK
jgi:hypothetical protein